MTSISSAFHQWRASRDALRAAKQAHRQEQSRAETAQKWGEPPSTAFFVRKVGEREADFQARIAEDIERARAWTEWAEIPEDVVHTLPFFIVRFPAVPQEVLAQAPQPQLPAPEPVARRALPAAAPRETGMRALAGPQQARAEPPADPDDAFTDDPAVEIGDNPPLPGAPRPPKTVNPLMTRGRQTAARVTSLTSPDGCDWHAGWNGDPSTPDPQFAHRFVW